MTHRAEMIEKINDDGVVAIIFYLILAFSSLQSGAQEVQEHVTTKQAPRMWLVTMMITVSRAIVSNICPASRTFGILSLRWQHREGRHPSRSNAKTMDSSSSNIDCPVLISGAVTDHRTTSRVLPTTSAKKEDAFVCNLRCRLTWWTCAFWTLTRVAWK